MSPISDVEKRVKEIRRKTRRKYSAEDKIRIVLEGLRGEMTIAELCRAQGRHCPEPPLQVEQRLPGGR